MGSVPPSKRTMAARAKRLTSPEFVRGHVLPALKSRSEKLSSEWRASVIRNTGTGRLTIRYEFEDAGDVFAKLYSDGLGGDSYRAHCRVWASGFDHRSAFRVPQPLVFYPKQNLLLMKAVPGSSLSTAIGARSIRPLLSGCRLAGEWLARFHDSGVKFSEDDGSERSRGPGDGLGELTSPVRLAPDLLHLRELILEKLGKLPARGSCSIHGRYHLDHVYLDRKVVSVIDLDRCRVADPAIDLAEFVRVLRLRLFMGRLSAGLADRATLEFMRAYLGCRCVAPVSFGCYWAAFVLMALQRMRERRIETDERASHELERFHKSEILTALARNH